MKLFFDLFPVLLFFATFKYSENHPEFAAGWLATLLGLAVDLKLAPILLATLVVMLATIAQIVWTRLRHGKVDRILWISLALVMVMGGLTLAFQNEAFIKWKLTLLDWVFAAGMTFSALVLKKNAIKAMLGEQLKLPEFIWTRLNYAWIVFFAGTGLLNLYIAYNFSTDTWVNFKVFGTMGLMLVFMVVQGAMIWKYIEEEK